MQGGKTNPRLAMHLIAAQPSVFARMIERAGVEAELGLQGTSAYAATRLRLT